MSLDLEVTELEFAEIEQEVKVPGVNVRELVNVGLLAEGL